MGKIKKILLFTLLIGILLGCFVGGTIWGASELADLHGKEFMEKFMKLVSYVAMCILCIVGGMVWGIRLSKFVDKESERKIRKKVVMTVIFLVVVFFCIVCGLLHGAILIMVSV